MLRRGGRRRRTKFQQNLKVRLTHPLKQNYSKLYRTLQKALKAPKNSFTLSQTMNNQQTIGRIQEWRENATKTGKALPLKDLPLVFFGINVATLSAKEWFTIGANKTQAKQFDKLLKDKAKEGKNGGGLIEQVPIMLQLLHDNDTHSASGVNQLQLDLGLTRQELTETFRREQKEGKPITKRDRSLIDLGIDIALGITFNWFAVGGVEEDAAAYQHAIVNDVAEEGANGGGTLEKMKEMYKILSAKKAEEVVEKVEEKKEEEEEEDSESEEEDSDDEE